MKYGLTLSGGGVRGLAHCGVLKALQEAGIRPSVISGTSAGAIVGALYSAGHSPEKILEIVIREKFFSYKRLLFRKAGLFDMKLFDDVYRKYILADSFDALEIPLYVAATDIIQGESVIYSSGPLFQILQGSACVPLVFLPIHFEGRTLLDGGITNNFPIEPIIDQCDFLIGVNVNSLSTKLEEIHMKDMVDRSFHLVLSKATAEKAKLCNLFIEPPDMSRFGIFDFKKAYEIFETGYEYARSVIPKTL